MDIPEKTEETKNSNQSTPPAIGTRKDYTFGIIAGLLIGFLALPILKTAKPSLYTSIQYILVPIFVALTLLGLVVASWIGKKFAFVWQLSKFVVIGGMNTLVDIGILAFISSLVLETSVATTMPWFYMGTITITFFSLYKACSFIIANINSFFWNKYWTFQQSDTKKAGAEFIQFFAVSFIGFIINNGISSAIFSAHSAVNFNSNQWVLVSAAIGSIAGLAWNFIGYKFIVFKR